MSLLLDENLSPRLVVRSNSLFPEMRHVRDVGLAQSRDLEIWTWALRNRHTLLTADADFVALANRLIEGPKVIHIERCDFPFHVIEDLLRQNAIRIAEFESDPKRRLLTLQK